MGRVRRARGRRGVRARAPSRTSPVGASRGAIVGGDERVRRRRGLGRHLPRLLLQRRPPGPRARLPGIRRALGASPRAPRRGRPSAHPPARPPRVPRRGARRPRRPGVARRRRARRPPRREPPPPRAHRRRARGGDLDHGPRSRSRGRRVRRRGFVPRPFSNERRESRAADRARRRDCRGSPVAARRAVFLRPVRVEGRARGLIRGDRDAEAPRRATAEGGGRDRRRFRRRLRDAALARVASLVARADARGRGRPRASR